jgi:tetratricopeptide (TPR) repeat protein
LFLYRQARIADAQDALSASIFLEQGVYEMNLGKYETAISSFSRVIEEDQDHETPYNLRSCCLSK